MGRPDCIQVFYRRDFDSAEISLLDERNALWRQRQALRDERSLLAPLQRFLQSLLYRRNALSLAEQVPAALDIRYYELLSNDGRVHVEPREAPEALAGPALYELQALLERGERKRVQVTLYCDHQEFSELEYGAGLFKAVAPAYPGASRGKRTLPLLPDRPRPVAAVRRRTAANAALSAL
ncbi:adenylate cyclase [Pseudomonas aeruginosa]|nr:adenylate cyclase [Pseudomonas aeruginosa]